MINCQTCGEDNPEGSKFCMNCGSSMQRIEPTRQYNQPQTRQYSRPNQPRTQPGASTWQSNEFYPKHQEPLSVWAYICTCCIPLAGLAIYFSIRENRPDEANTILILAILNLALAFISGVT